ncbi:sensor histidine kinase [Luteococcus peritonei]|uniref:Sensor histidine kinase n=1 Tax=Luteococcus peritonei TaxID=88874 RepID=A0ABW4RYQ4_9ACTN
MDATGQARRLGTMLRHSMHLVLGVLWLVGCWRSLHQPWALLLAACWLAAYVAGLVWQARHRGRSRRAGRSWVACLVGLWLLLCLCSPVWAWLGFPLFFLVLFILPRPADAVVLAAMTGWMVVSPLLLGQRPTVGGVLGPVLAAGAAVLSWLVFRQLREDVAEQRRLAHQVAEGQQELLRAAEAAARTQERDRLARDLHDTLAQGLNSIVVLSRSAAARHPQAAGELELIESSARENLAQARQLVRRMTEPAADLEAELGRLVADTARREQALGSGLQLELRTDGTARPLPGAAQEALLMATRTLLANVVQHADARRCVVSLGWHEQEVTLDVVDDGTGFEPGQVGQGSYGLTGLQARLDALGGQLQLDSTPGQGTSVGLRVALGGGRP